MGLCFVAILTVGCFEKQRIHDFEPMGSDLLQVPSPYFQAMSEDSQILA
jgi:hypothetical protein